LGNHRIERAIERYGIPFTERDLAACQAQVNDRKSLVVEKQAHGLVQIVKHGDLPMICVTTDNGTIVTFLPPNAISKGARAVHYAPKTKRERKPKRWQVKQGR
jgi:hypothetical protein